MHQPFFDADGVTIYHGDCRRVLASLPEGCVHTCVTSPPYWGLRDYGVAGQLGLEQVPDCLGWATGDLCGECYVCRLTAVFRELRRVLRHDGTLWLNLGDTYAGYWGDKYAHMPFGKDRKADNSTPPNKPSLDFKRSRIKPKDLIGIPWRVALALQSPWKEPTCVQSDRDRAWLAALFDGEGCIGIRRFDSYRTEPPQEYQDGFVAYTTVTNSDIELLDRCVMITGFGRPRIKQRAETVDRRGIIARRDSYGWRLDGNKAIQVVQAIYPFLVAKRKQACLAYTLDVLNKSARSMRGNGPVPREIQDKKAYLKDLIHRCNQRNPVDLPSWIKEPEETVQPGWYLRSDIIWAKRNPMPQSATDRPTRSHEYVFLLTKERRYFYDGCAIREPLARANAQRTTASYSTAERYGVGNGGNGGLDGLAARMRNGTHAARNKRTVWSLSTKPFKGAHFAVFPPDLVTLCILAGTSEAGGCPLCGAPYRRVVERNRVATRPGRDSKIEGRNATQVGNRDPQRHVTETQTLGWQPGCECDAGEAIPCTVLDPFLGSGTTAAVAQGLGCRCIGVELNEAYCHLAADRFRQRSFLVSA